MDTPAEIEANRIIDMFRDQDLSESGLISISLMHVKRMLNMLDGMYNGYYTMPLKIAVKVDFLEEVVIILQDKLDS